MTEYPLALQTVTPYEFFRYHQAGEFYSISTALQAGQIGALDRVARTIAGQNYYLAAQVDATSRVVSAVEAQSPLLRDISSAVREGTFVIGSQLMDVNSHLGTIEGLMEENIFLQGIQIEQLEDIKRSGRERNLLLNQGNQLSRDLVVILAKQNGIDPSDIDPENFPRPPIPKPATIPERIRTARAREDYALLLLARYGGVFGQDRIEEALVRYIQVPDQELAQLNPSGFADGMISDAYKKGRTATNDLRTSVDEYDTQLNLIDSAITKTIKDSRAKALLEEVKREVWKGANGVVSPIVVDINYGEIPEKDRNIIAGYKLETPPRYKPANMSVLAIIEYKPAWILYSPKGNETDTLTNIAEILILVGDPTNGIPFSSSLLLTDWGELLLGQKWGLLASFFEIYPEKSKEWLEGLGRGKNFYARNKGPYNIAFAKKIVSLADLPSAIRESQAQRVLRGELPQNLNAQSNARLAEDQQRVKELSPVYQTKLAELKDNEEELRAILKSAEKVTEERDEIGNNIGRTVGELRIELDRRRMRVGMINEDNRFFMLLDKLSNSDSWRNIQNLEALEKRAREKQKKITSQLDELRAQITQAASTEQKIKRNAITIEKELTSLQAALEDFRKREAAFFAS